MGKIKALVTDMGYDSAKRYLEELKLKLERDKKKEWDSKEWVEREAILWGNTTENAYNSFIDTLNRKRSKHAVSNEEKGETSG